MPSRNAGPATPQASDPRRSSARRLSSIASLGNLNLNLNPFVRRRSANKTNSPADCTAVSSTNASTSTLGSLSSSSTLAIPPQITHHAPASSSRLFHHDEQPEADFALPIPTPPLPTQATSKRGSYICLPDDPIGGMPRSRTFSNLPLPTRAARRAPPTMMPASKSHSRLPSALLRVSRLPSPPISVSTSKTYAGSKLAAVDQRLPYARSNNSRIPRADTEPLLHPVSHARSGTQQQPRSTAFKENLSLSPVKPLPPMSMFDNRDLYGSRLPSRSYASRHAWTGDGDGGAGGNDPHLLGGRSTEHHLPHRHAAHLFQQQQQQHPNCVSISSPTAYRSSRHRAPTPGNDTPSQPEELQRWASQPVLTDITNRSRRLSQHGDIRQLRLMSEVPPAPQAKKAAIQPPNPQPYNITSSLLPASNTQSLAFASPHHLFSSSSPASSFFSQPSPLTSHPPHHPFASPHDNAAGTGRGGEIQYRLITTSEPPPYWAGRFAALTDRLRNEELHAHLRSTSPSNNTDQTTSDLSHQQPEQSSISLSLSLSGEEGAMPSPSADVKRMRAALEHLHALCGTAEARASFGLFQTRMAASYGGSVGLELARPIRGRLILPPSGFREGADYGTCRINRGRREDGAGDGLEGGRMGSVRTPGGDEEVRISELRKASFIDRLLGRSRTRLVD